MANRTGVCKFKISIAPRGGLMTSLTVRGMIQMVLIEKIYIFRGYTRCRPTDSGRLRESTGMRK